MVRRISHALVRAVPESYHRCLRATPVDIDVAAARIQHAAYVRALRDAGVAVTELPQLDDAPDSVFVEDPVVVLQKHALLTRPGAPSRREEGASMSASLSAFELETMSEPATLDGGDVLWLGMWLFVGITERTNAAGIERLAELAKLEGIETVPMQARGGLHLKSVVTPVGDAVIGLFDRIDREPFASREIDIIDAPEDWGANVLDLGTRVLISAAAPRTAELLAAKGYRTSIVDVGEFHKGDGALTCLSVRFAARAAG